MFLSEAIKKREQLLIKAEEMNEWYSNQRYGQEGIKWPELRKAIEEVIGKAYEDWRKYDEAIEKDIKQLEIDIT